MKGRGSEDYPVDFVLLWVDGSDEKWQEQKRLYKASAGQDDSAKRFRSWDNLEYWFRGVEKYAPWVNHIFFITCGQAPDWLKKEHPRLRCVNHEDFIPHEYLPTFNSNVIELHLHRIEELSEHFVLFNDDMFLTAPVKKSDFFIDGLPADQYMEYPIGSGTNPAMPHIFVNNINIIAKHYSRKEILKAQRRKILNLRYGFGFFYNLLMYLLPFPNYFGVLAMHVAYPHLKSVFAQLWETEPEAFEETSRHRFREIGDISHYLCRMWYLSRGQFVPVNRMKKGKMYKIGYDEEKMYRDIRRNRYKMICIVDEVGDYDFEIVKKEMLDSLMAILPDKSSFEK